MKKYLCSVCNYVELKGGAPEKCPNCGAPQSSFKEKEDAIKQSGDPGDLTDLEKKHIPLISVNKECGFIEGCVDINVKMGEIVHPMEEKHYITVIDFYIDREFISRVKLTPKNMQPAGSVHLKEAGGEINVVSHCNIHGNWTNSKKLQ